MTVATENPFVKGRTDDQIVIAGFIFNSFFGYKYPETIDTPSGNKASGFVAFHGKRDDQLEYLYVERVETSTVRYRVTITGGGNSKEIVGYSLPDLLDFLEDDKRSHALSGDDGFNYAGISFFYDENRVGKFYSVCLSAPTDPQAQLRLEVTVEKFPEGLSE